MKHDKENQKAFDEFLINMEVKKKAKELWEKWKKDFPWYFNILGQLKNSYRNKGCLCESGYKMKDCHAAIIYVGL